MCGQLTLRTPAAILGELFGLAEIPAWTPRYNIAPTHPIASDFSERLNRRDILRAVIGISCKIRSVWRDKGLVRFWLSSGYCAGMWSIQAEKVRVIYCTNSGSIPISYAP